MELFRLGRGGFCLNEADIQFIIQLFCIQIGGALAVDNVNLSAQVPEPSALLMAFGGLAGLVWSRRRQVESLAG